MEPRELIAYGLMLAIVAAVAWTILAVRRKKKRDREMRHGRSGRRSNQGRHSRA